jgi:hypothetical protein
VIAVLDEHIELLIMLQHRRGWSTSALLATSASSLLVTFGDNRLFALNWGVARK